MARQLIGLVDCNNFFVSCERLFRPDLQQKPVVVLSSNDGCVVARSQEIKDKGIPMGAPLFQIKDSLSQMGAVTFSSHFSLYRDVSRRVFNVVRRELGSIEQYSIDEAFFMVSEDEALLVAERARQVVLREVGIPVSVGLGLSKTQAKYANAVAKKTTGVCLLRPEIWEERWSSIPLYDIWGVGSARARQFGEHGLRTVGDFVVLPRFVTRRLFGIEGERLWGELRGEVPVQLQSDHGLQKTLMSTRSFADETKSLAVVRDALLYHLHEIVEDLVKQRAVATTLRVIAYPSRFSDYAFRGMSVEIPLTAPTDDIFTLEHLVVDALDTHFRPDVPYKKAGIVVSVAAADGMTTSLFETEETSKTKVLTDTMFIINKQQGKGMLRLGFVGSQKNRWSARTEALSPDYTTNWKCLCVVKA